MKPVHRARQLRPYNWDRNFAVLGENDRFVGARAAGVDLLPDKAGGLLVIEVNAVPGWRALSSATGVDVARLLLLDLMEARR